MGSPGADGNSVGLTADLNEIQPPAPTPNGEGIVADLMKWRKFASEEELFAALLPKGGLNEHMHGLSTKVAHDRYKKKGVVPSELIDLHRGGGWSVPPHRG